MSNILITGGLGFIGSHIVECFIENNQNVVVIDNESALNSGYRNNRATYINLDICTEKLEDIFKENHFDVCVHLAAQASVTKGEYVFFLDSDDYLVSDILDKLYAEAKKNDIDILMSKCKAFADGEIINTYTRERVSSLNKYLDYKEVYDIQVTKDNFLTIINNYPCVSCGSLYKLNFLNKNHLKFIDKNIIHEDNGFFLKTYAMMPKATFLNLISIMYRVRSNSISYESCKKENKDKQDEQLKIIIKDAINYINNYSGNNAKKMIADIKMSDKYNSYFSIVIKGVFTYIWGKNNKRIKILGFPIYREKIRKDNLIIKLFGIPIFIKKLNMEVISDDNT